MDREEQAMWENGCWEVADFPDDKSLIAPTLWVLTYKTDGKFKVILHKARNVVQGNRIPKHALDLLETNASVVKFTTLRVVLALVTQYNLNCEVVDVCTAFLYGDIPQEQYIYTPQGVHLPPGKCIRLRKSQYGLPNAPRCWQKKLHKFLSDQGFRRGLADDCMYVRSREGTGEYTIVLVYVDDMLLASTHDLTQLKADFKSTFKIKELGNIATMLGLLVERDRSLGRTKLSQSKFIAGMLETHGMSDCKPQNSPADSGTVLVKVAPDTLSVEAREQAKSYPFLSVGGSLLFPSRLTRPDIAFPVGNALRYSAEPAPMHVNALSRIMRYLKATPERGIAFQASKVDSLAEGVVRLRHALQHGDDALMPVAWVDADWAGSLDDRKSTTGFIIKMAGGPVSWMSSKQKMVALSSTEAEVLALLEVAKELVWLRRLLSEMGFPIGDKPTLVHEDNQSCIALTKGPGSFQRTKHFDLKVHWLRDIVEQNVLDVQYISTDEQQADPFTKPLAVPAFLKITEEFMVD
jgi:hypothetical protein